MSVAGNLNVVAPRRLLQAYAFGALRQTFDPTRIRADADPDAEHGKLTVRRPRRLDKARFDITGKGGFG